MNHNRCTVTVRPRFAFATVNVRSGPGTHYARSGMIAVGTADLPVLDVQPDDLGRQSPHGRVHQWFWLEIAADGSGWMRDDLLELHGDCSALGYGVVLTPTRASALIRRAPVLPELPPLDDSERIRKAAFNITAGFEGRGYASYQNFDAGVVSYGRFQFTLASGALFSVIDHYLRGASGAVADQLQGYRERILDRDMSLRHDRHLRDLLLQAAGDPAMRAAQDSVAAEHYWQRAVDLSVTPRQLRRPLSYALIFDMAINHGRLHDLINRAEEALNIPLKAPPALHNVTEERLMQRTAQVRRDRMYAFAGADPALQGLKPRVDFWLRLIDAGDWDLQGDVDGFVLLKPGRRVQVRNP
ncbi:MAG: hypothetical protein GYB67_17565 [Chloroflexi bacterium]|nr:hypothetical protein [Chloroflexota bacterium]